MLITVTTVIIIIFFKASLKTGLILNTSTTEIRPISIFDSKKFAAYNTYLLKSEKAKNGDKTWYKWKIELDSMLTDEAHVTEASAFSKDMGAAKEKLQPEMEEDKTSSEKIPF